MSCAASCPTTTAASAALPEKRKRLGARPPKISAASAASSTSASSAMTTSCSGTAAVSKSRPNQNASASPVPRCSSANPFEEASRSTKETFSRCYNTLQKLNEFECISRRGGFPGVAVGEHLYGGTD